ncbi:MAG: hypothetical protein KAI47_05455, partial [Deltaproteobacteria bacterium]|nr:hypothetical protein [Deltaproteobacteria bacterium]
FGIVANTARGDVAFFRTSGGGEPLVDLDHATPGFGFVPVGAWPRDVATTPDGCRAVTANAGSCDLSVIDVPGALRLASGKLERPAGGLVSTIIPHTAAGPLGARPERLVIVPSSVPAKADDAVCAVSTAYRGYVSFPRCGLVAEIDLRDGKILRGLQITKDGYQMTDSPICPRECSGKGQLAASDATPGDLTQGEGTQDQGSSGASDARSDGASHDAGVADVRGDGVAPDASAADIQIVDAGVDAAGDASGDSAGEMHDDFRGEALADASDASLADASRSDSAVLPVGPAGVLPIALALMPDGGKLFISSGGATFITAVDIAKDGSFEDPRRIVLAGTRAQTRRLAISPPTAKVGQFLYAIAADRSVRVVSLAIERECETNADVLTLPAKVDIKRASCFPVGDPETPPRRVIADEGPGLTFGTRLPEDVTFARVARDPADEVPSDKTKITATPLVGVFAFVATSDGNVFVIDVEDENRITSDATSVSREYLPHRVRNALQGTDDA